MEGRLRLQPRSQFLIALLKRLVAGVCLGLLQLLAFEQFAILFQNRPVHGLKLLKSLFQAGAGSRWILIFGLDLARSPERKQKHDQADDQPAWLLFKMKNRASAHVLAPSLALRTNAHDFLLEDRHNLIY